MADGRLSLVEMVMKRRKVGYLLYTGVIINTMNSSAGMNWKELEQQNSRMLLEPIGFTRQMPCIHDSGSVNHLSVELVIIKV